MYGRDRHNSVKQLSANQKKNQKNNVQTSVLWC